MHTHLKDRSYYEDIYDRLTVEDGRRGMKVYDDFFTDFEKKLPKDGKIDRPGNAILLNAFYIGVVGNDLIERYNKRGQSISEMMARDEAKDAQLAEVRLTEEPSCRHCHKQGLRIIDKSLMHRSEEYEYGDPEEVLFMLKCPYCKKNSVYWEDGAVWKPKPTLCPRCKAEMNHKTRKNKQSITLVYTCTKCEHSYKDKLDTSTKKEKPDPEYDKDRAHFCLHNKEYRDKLFKIKHDFEEMAKLGKELKEKTDNKHIYDAMKELKKPKIAELSTLLGPVLEKAGYTEFSLDKPEIGKDVIVGFNCLDSKSDREDYDSRKTLQKLVRKTLEGTNWRLMNDGISYRLGYLNGRLRAYEKKTILSS